jgi:hypothetical protein
MGTFIDILICVAMAAVVASLALGLFSVVKGGDFSLKYSNKFMRWRVWTQAAAVLLLTLGFWYKATH